MAGDESRTNAEHPDEPAQVAAFQKAFDNGVHRTVHAAEAGPAWNAWEAVEILHAERIGHCYHCLDSADIYTYVCLCEREKESSCERERELVLPISLLVAHRSLNL